MANEAKLLFELQHPIPFTVANGTGIEKGALLKMTDPMTAASENGTNMLAGIAASEKIASDGKTKLGVYREGIFKMTASESIAIGDAVTGIATWTNHVKKAEATVSASAVLGHALETATNGETFRVHVRVGCGGNQIS
jgi:predicted RecA/RadA family phage recombinase